MPMGTMAMMGTPNGSDMGISPGSMPPWNAARQLPGRRLVRLRLRRDGPAAAWRHCHAAAPPCGRGAAGSSARLPGAGN